MYIYKKQTWFITLGYVHQFQSTHVPPPTRDITLLSQKFMISYDFPPMLCFLMLEPIFPYFMLFIFYATLGGFYTLKCVQISNIQLLELFREIYSD